jgi:aspartokinase
MKAIMKAEKACHFVVAVVSAMGDTTDEFIELAHGINPSAPDREIGMLLSARGTDSRVPSGHGRFAQVSDGVAEDKKDITTPR